MTEDTIQDCHSDDDAPSIINQEDTTTTLTKRNKHRSQRMIPSQQWDLLVAILFFALMMGVVESRNSGDATYHKSKTQHTSRAEAFRVKGLEEVVPAFEEFEGDMFAGLLPLSEHDDGGAGGELMFWLFLPHPSATAPRPNNHSNSTPPLMASPETLTIWLNGGPGCSSIGTGALFECSPVTTPHHPAGFFDTKHTMKQQGQQQPFLVNEWAWTQTTNLLFIEQPAGVGFTHGPEAFVEADVAEDFYYFLRHFYRTFPHLMTQRLFLFGESYAGYYVPSIAHRLHRENEQERDYRSRHYSTSSRHRENNRHNDPSTALIPLAGIGIGNGWMDAMVQGPFVIDYAYWHGMIDSTTRDGLHVVWGKCEASHGQQLQQHHTAAAAAKPKPTASSSQLQAPFHSFTITDECNIVGAVLIAAGAGIFNDMSPNQYDVSTWDTYPVLFDPNSTINQFYNNPKVKQAVHAPKHKEWKPCIEGAGRRRRRLEHPLRAKTFLIHDKPESMMPYIAELLDDAGIHVLIYAGDRDLAVNAQGSEKLLDTLAWNHSDTWKTAQRGLWMVDGQVAGYVKTMANLDFLIVRGSGHLVPTNVPRSALDMITRMVTDTPYNDQPLPTFHRPRENVTAAMSPEELVTLLTQQNGAFQIFLNLSVAIVCFMCGYLAASWRDNQRRREQYTSIPSA